jgi:hypothetical protein
MRLQCRERCRACRARLEVVPAPEGALELLDRARVASRCRGENLGGSACEGSEQRGLPRGGHLHVEQEKRQAYRMRRRFAFGRSRGRFEGHCTVGKPRLRELALCGFGERGKIRPAARKPAQLLWRQAVHAKLLECARDGGRKARPCGHGTKVRESPLTEQAVDRASRDSNERQTGGRRAPVTCECGRSEAGSEMIQCQANRAEAGTGRRDDGSDEIVTRLPCGRDDEHLGISGMGAQPVRGGGDPRLCVGGDEQTDSGALSYGLARCALAHGRWRRPRPTLPLLQPQDSRPVTIARRSSACAQPRPQQPSSHARPRVERHRRVKRVAHPHRLAEEIRTLAGIFFAHRRSHSSRIIREPWAATTFVPRI